MIRNHVRAAVCAAVIGASFGVAPAASAATFMPSQFVVFGDSFVDAGSVNRFTNGALAPAEAGFWQGRWSDGPNWVDYLGYANFATTTKAFNAGVGPGQLPPPFQLGATNFAVGGARGSGDDVQVTGTIPGLNTQLGLYQLYLTQFGLGVDPDALYIINFGNNDVNYIQSLAGDPAAQAAVATAYVTNMTNAALGLASAGANHILIAGVPNPLEVEGQVLQAALNASLAAQAPTFSFLGADVQQFDYFAFFIALQSDPTQFGLPAGLDFNSPCLVAQTPSPDIDCRNYLSFDGIHVTTGVQRAISIQVANQLGISAVPEPATWAMMILGFGAVGFMARRRRVALAA
jgi:phospholipase/lecithinase/hemolysin